jgi:hypothetical protein
LEALSSLPLYLKSLRTPGHPAFSSSYAGRLLVAAVAAVAAADEHQVLL